VGHLVENRKLMAILQLAAAWLAGIDHLVYHTFDRAGTKGYQDGKQILQEKFLDKPPITAEEFVNELFAMEFQWGVSDGN